MSQKKARLAISVKDQSTKIQIIDEMHVYKLPLKSAPSYSEASSIVKRFSFGDPNQRIRRENKTILLMGATGSGKTTMINAMINYILGVEWEDDFRFMLVDEEVRKTQAHSQTRGVTAYDLHYQDGFRIPFSLTIVDTPGFGDTQGIKQDKEITSAIETLLTQKNGIEKLDAVGFVVQSALVRLTSSQKYIFNSVLSIFGTDIGENVRFLVTFADGDQPPVLEAIKEAKLPCRMDSTGSPCHQSFNNCAVYKSKTSAKTKRLQYCWDDALTNFESFFDDLRGMTTKSLEMTREVLRDRRQLETKLKWVQSAVPKHLSMTAELRTKEAEVELQKERIKANQNFEIQVSVYKKVQTSLGGSSALNCMECETTCHHPCDPDLPLRVCPAFYASVPTLLSPFALVINTIVNNNCEVCTGGCSPSQHRHQNYKWEYKHVMETQTIDSMRQNYQDALGKQSTAEALVRALKEEASQLKDEIRKTKFRIFWLHTKLEENALTGNSLATPDYIQEMIYTEGKQKNEGYAERIRSLKQLVDLVQLNSNIVDNEGFALQFKLFN